MEFHITPYPGQSADATWFIFNRDKVMLLGDALPRSTNALQLTWVRFVGNLGDMPCYVGELIGEAPQEANWYTLRQKISVLPKPYQHALSRAWQLLQFERCHRYCSQCASPLSKYNEDGSKTCQSCNAVYYPRISPAMMVVVMRYDEILLARAPHFSPGLYSALAGFVEPGETLEACVHREVMEEVGIRIDGLRYMGSQQWPFPHSLMLAFQAQYVSGDITPQPGEIDDARWFKIDELPILPMKASIAHWLIEQTIHDFKKSAPRF